jgi:two-component sensor histidine kinase
MIKRLLNDVMRLGQKISLPPTLRGRVIALIGMGNLVLLVLVTVSVNTFVYRVESKAWRGRQLDAAHNAAQTITDFLQRNQDALRWIDMLGYDEVMNRPEILQQVLNHYPAFLEIAVLDSQGHIIADTARSTALFENLFTTSQSEWFRTAQAGWEYYTRVQISAQDEPYLIFSMPNQKAGVLAARIKMDVLSQVVAYIHFGEGGSVFVINQTGQVNAHTDPNVVLANASMDQSPEFQAILQAPDREWYGERVNFNHQRVVSVTTAIGQTGWTVITELPVSEAYAASRLIRVALPVGLLILLAIITWFIRYVLIHFFLRSVDILRDGAARLGEGELGHRMEIPRMDELGGVISVFNQMAARLEAQRLILQEHAADLEVSEQRYRLLSEQLEERVAERTAELRSEIHERTRAEERLNTSLQEKDVLLKEIHHRVKNNLQIITSLLNLQSRMVSDPNTLEVLHDSQNRVRSMALIHEKLYQSDNLAQVNFDEYLHSLVPSLLRTYQRGHQTITLNYDIEDTPLPLELAIPCGLIVNELVTNALKYAFPQDRGGKLWIELHKTSTQGFALRVADNGVGLPSELDIHNPPNLGLQLVNSLVSQLEGNVEIDREKGTAFTIIFKKAHEEDMEEV